MSVLDEDECQLFHDLCPQEFLLLRFCYCSYVVILYTTPMFVIIISNYEIYSFKNFLNLQNL